MGVFAQYRRQDDMRSRAVKGAILLALVLAVIPLVSLVWSTASSLAPSESNSAFDLVISQQDDLPSAWEFSQQWGGSSFADDVFAVEDVAAQLPEAYRREIPLLDDVKDMRVADNGRLVGFTKTGSSSAICEECTLRMEAAGWTGMPSGNQGQASFVKSSGTYRWAYIACYQIGDACSVVVIADSEEQEAS